MHSSDPAEVQSTRSFWRSIIASIGLPVPWNATFYTVSLVPEGLTQKLTIISFLSSSLSTNPSQLVARSAIMNCFSKPIGLAQRGKYAAWEILMARRSSSNRFWSMEGFPMLDGSAMAVLAIDAAAMRVENCMFGLNRVLQCFRFRILGYAFDIFLSFPVGRFPSFISPICQRHICRETSPSHCDGFKDISTVVDIGYDIPNTYLKP